MCYCYAALISLENNNNNNNFNINNNNNFSQLRMSTCMQNSKTTKGSYRVRKKVKRKTLLKRIFPGTLAR